jgi:hypothetical protein
MESIKIIKKGDDVRFEMLGDEEILLNLLYMSCVQNEDFRDLLMEVASHVMADTMREIDETYKPL